MSRNRTVKCFCLCAAVIMLCLGIVSSIQDYFFRNRNQALPEPAVWGKQEVSAVLEELASAGDEAKYVEELQELLEKNEEAWEYVQGYPDREKYMALALDMKEDFTDGEVPLLMQWDKRWGYDAYGDSMIGLAGCGPLCLEMAYLYFTQDTDMTPRDMARFADDNGYYTESGTSWSLWTEGAGKLGITGTELPLDENRMRRELDSGALIVCSMWPGDFTTTGHFILIRGYGEEGFFVNDPNRRSNSEKTWDYETLQRQIRNLWALRKG